MNCDKNYVLHNNTWNRKSGFIRLEELLDDEKEHILSFCEKKLNEYYERTK